MSACIQFRRGTAAEWAAENPVLADGELGLVTDTRTYKIGNGVDDWLSLSAQELSPEMAAILFNAVVSEPSPPSAGQMTMYAREIAGRMMPKWVGPSGLDTVCQPALFNNSIVLITPATTTTMSVMGIGAPTVVGTASTPAIVAGSGMRQGLRRTTFTSAASAGSVCGPRVPIALCYRGDTGGVGGFFFNVRFSIAVAPASDSKFIIGLFNTTAAIAAATQPSAIANFIGVGWDSTDTRLKLMYNDGSGSATKIDLGANFPRDNTSAVYDLTIYNPPCGGTVMYRVKRLDTAVADATGSLTTDIPGTTTTLTFNSKFDNGATAAAVAFDLTRMYLETDT